MRWQSMVMSLCVAGSVGCAEGKLVEPSSQVHADTPGADYFIPKSSIGRCTVSYALEPEIRVCMRGAASGKPTDLTLRALDEWFDALRTLNPNVTDNFALSCDQPHLRVDVNRGNGRAYAGCGFVNTYTQRPYGSYLHELGHAVAGLRDTYMGSAAGRCKPGQPESIMCWGAYGKQSLYPDDLEGIRRQFKRVPGWESGGRPDPVPDITLDLAINEADSRLRASTEPVISQVYACTGEATICPNPVLAVAHNSSSTSRDFVFAPELTRERGDRPLVLTIVAGTPLQTVAVSKTLRLKPRE